MERQALGRGVLILGLVLVWVHAGWASTGLPGIDGATLSFTQFLKGCGYLLLLGGVVGVAVALISGHVGMVFGGIAAVLILGGVFAGVEILLGWVGLAAGATLGP